MDFLMQEKSYDLTILEASHHLASMSDYLTLYLLEKEEDDDIKDAEENVEVTAKFEKFKQSALATINKILEVLKSFFRDLMIQINIQVERIKLNKKLKELKDVMARKRAKALNRKFNYFNIRKYKAYYSQFINRYTAELKRGLNKDFKTVEEYEKWRVDMLNRLSDFNYKLTDEEQWKLSISINSAVKLSEEEATNKEKNVKMVEEDGNNSIKTLEKYYKGLDSEHSYINYGKDKLKIFNLQNSFIAMVCSKLMEAIKTVAKIITKHTFLCITGVLVVLIAL